MKKLLENFRSPGAEFRGMPFWAWNAKLDKEELIRQIHTFKAMGLGGFFMHARVGLNTPYLSEEWFDCVKACVSEAKKLGMKANLYDEDRWPSGTAGSLAVQDEAYKHRYCSLEIYSSADECVNAEKGITLAWFSAKVSGTVEQNDLSVKSPERLKSPTDFQSGKSRKLIRFARYIPDATSWFNGATYIDTLNPDAVRKFIEVTHEAYLREVGEEFGNTIPAIFTDEPTFHYWGNAGNYCLPWTDKLPELFQKKYHLDLLDHLPEIFFTSIRKCSAVRMDFFDLITELFVQSYFGTIGNWCQKHNINLTGHLYWEDRLMQTMYAGAAMRSYEYMQMPGIDLLTEHWRIFNTVKQCSSVAHQFGRRWRVSETYGCTGWDFPFAGHKALGDWQYALGINSRCQHLAWYSAEGEAKRDYPASISYQSSWYDRYHVVEDYFGRLGAILSDGKEMCDLLVIHPIESAWMKISVADVSGSLAKEENAFINVTDTLLSQKLDFDFGDEEIISRFGKVENHRLQINKAAYQAVLIPSLLTIRSTTLNLLEKFADQGGIVVYLDKVPEYLDGNVSKYPEKVFAKFHKTTLSGSVKILENAIRKVSVTAPAGRQIKPILASLRAHGDTFSLFLCNYGSKFNTASMMDDCAVLDRKLKFPQAKVEVIVPNRGKVYELNLSDGSIYSIDAVYKKDRYIFNTAFDELESHLYLITAENLAIDGRKRSASDLKQESRLPAMAWDFELSEQNILVLDHAECYADCEMISPKGYILQLDDKLRQMLGKPVRGGAMMQPWFKELQKPEKSIDLKLTYHIQIKDVPDSDCRLALEHPEAYRFELNGKLLINEVKSWWCDRTLQCIDIPSEVLLRGDNILTLYSRYHENLPGLEAMFLLGNFGVSESEEITALPEKLVAGDWGKQGLRHYAGNVSYIREVEIPVGGVNLNINVWGGSLLGVKIDNGDEKILPWPPYEVWIPEGTHNLSITVYGNRRNAMGPFFCDTLRPAWTGPNQFKALDVDFRQLVPFGLLEEPIIKVIK